MPIVRPSPMPPRRVLSREDIENGILAKRQTISVPACVVEEKPQPPEPVTLGEKLDAWRAGWPMGHSLSSSERYLFSLLHDLVERLEQLEEARN